MILGEKKSWQYPNFSEINDLSGDLVDDVAVADPGNGALVEGHDVLGEGAGFVREYVLYLTELLVKGGCAGACVSVRRRVVHLLVPIYEKRLDETYHLHAHVEAYRDHGVQDYRVGEEHQQSYDRSAYQGLLRYQRVPR